MAAPGLSAGAVLRSCLGTDAARLIAADPIARLGEDTEGVHQARVATRRLRSHLTTFAEVLRPGPTERLSKDLRWLGRALAPVRDADVLIGRLADAVRSIDPMSREGGLVLLARAHEERGQHTAALDEVLAAPRYRALLEHLAGTVASPPFLRSAGLPAEEFLAARIAARYGVLRDGIDALSSAPLDVELHEVRILAKPVRYAAEAGVRVLGSRCAKFSKRVTDLCDELGELHDGARMSLWLDQVGLEPGVAATVARVRTVEIGRVADARAAWIRADTRLRVAAGELGVGAEVPAAG